MTEQTELLTDIQMDKGHYYSLPYPMSADNSIVPQCHSTKIYGDLIVSIRFF